ncbi:hypothetical protein [Pantoea allii]|uniref:hypothetical protein n=1 Tax=Pantoea allii TaxID=574096 RepID=UPI001301F9BD|nr:hypothetical protein [Pantoea allii]MBW1253243.1 hypothetical protein [Pantoea allii]MBW1262661.1 hypothetical protein [Pantoea allii]MBW1284499.1 hypothetical protein [Pantoea allii]
MPERVLLASRQSGNPEEMRSENVMHGVGLKRADITVLNADEEHIEMMMQWVNARR